MKTETVSQVRIAAPPRQVFKYLDHLRYHRLWNPHLVRISPQTKARLGMVYNTESLLFGIKIEAANRVTKLEQDKALELANDTGLLIYDIAYTLEEQGGETVLTCRTNISADSPTFSFIKPILGTLARRELQSDLELLKAVIEQGVEI